MDNTHCETSTENENSGHYTYEKTSRVSPMGKKSPNFARSPGVCETPVRERRLSRICENDVYIPRTRPPAHGEPLTNLPIHTTPPSRLINFRVQNPFDSTLRKKLHMPFISPTLFTKTSSPSKDTEHFSWSIEDLANLYPADIDEFQAQNDQPCDENTEQEVQKSISRFFEGNVIVPSPWGTIDSYRQVPFFDLDCTPIKTERNPESHIANVNDYNVEERDNIISSQKKEAWTQTELTIPGDIPSLLYSLDEKIDPLEHVEKSPMSEHVQPLRSEPICSSPCFSSYKSLFSSTIHTPKSKILTRSFGTPLACTSLLSPIGLSPILHTFQHVTVNGEVSRESVESLCCSCLKDCDNSVDSGFVSTLSQTELVLPCVLPKSIEEILKPYQTFLMDVSELEEVKEVNLNSSFSRRRKLLFHENLDMSVSSINSLDNDFDSS